MSTTFQKKLATLAFQQHEKYHLIREAQEPLATQISKYWTDLGLAFPGVGTPWSAVFVSWCVKQSGANASNFKFSARHSAFVYQAISDAKKNKGQFQGRPILDYSPKVGDILQNNRGSNRFDFDYAATHKSYESHSAIVVEVGTDTKGKYLRTVGGNESDSVGLKEVRLDPSGRVINSQGLYISAIEVLL